MGENDLDIEQLMIENMLEDNDTKKRIKFYMQVHTSKLLRSSNGTKIFLYKADD